MAEWSVLIKVARATGASVIRRDDLDVLLERLPGTDKGVTGGDGLDATISFWVEATDAAAAIREGWRHIESRREGLGMEAWRPIRTHAASAAQRLTGFSGVESRVPDGHAWSVLMKATMPSDQEHGLDAAGRASIAERLGPDAAVAGDRHTVVARYWVSATDAEKADIIARAALLAAINAADDAGRWTIVRAHHAVASERAEELYRGAAERAVRVVQ